MKFYNDLSAKKYERDSERTHQKNISHHVRDPSLTEMEETEISLILSSFDHP